MKEADKRLISLESLLIRKGVITNDELKEYNDIWEGLEDIEEEHP